MQWTSVYRFILVVKDFYFEVGAVSECDVGYLSISMEAGRLFFIISIEGTP